jgi:transposase-like protein
MNNTYRDPDVLKNLYLDKNLSIKKIAKIFHVNPRTIWYWLIRHKIPRRKSNIIRSVKLRVSKEELINLYIKRRLSASQVAKKVGIKSVSNILIALHKYGIPVRDRYEALVTANTKYSKKSFSGNLKEKAYLLGLRIGDLEVRKDRNLIRIRVCSSKKSQIDMFKKVFGKYSKVRTYSQVIQGRKEIFAYTYLDNTFKFLLDKPSKLPKWIISGDKFYSFLAGYVDAEGSWKINKSHRDAINFTFYIGSEDELILEQIRDRLTRDGFSAHLYLEKKKGQQSNLGSYNKDLYAVCIFRKTDVVRLAKILLPLSRHMDKIKRMKLILEIKDKKWHEVKEKVERLIKRHK